MLRNTVCLLWIATLVCKENRGENPYLAELIQPSLARWFSPSNLVDSQYEPLSLSGQIATRWPGIGSIGASLAYVPGAVVVTP